MPSTALTAEIMGAESDCAPSVKAAEDTAPAAGVSGPADGAADGPVEGKAEGTVEGKAEGAVDGSPASGLLPACGNSKKFTWWDMTAPAVPSVGVDLLSLSAWAGNRQFWWFGAFSAVC